MPHNTLSTIWSAQTAPGTAPADTAQPTADQSTPDVNGVRCRECIVEFDFTVTSGSGAAVVRPYLWDGELKRWVKSTSTLAPTTAATTSSAASREAHTVDPIYPYQAITFVLESITGNGASITCRAASR